MSDHVLQPEENRISPYRIFFRERKAAAFIVLLIIIFSALSILVHGTGTLPVDIRVTEFIQQFRMQRAVPWPIPALMKLVIGVITGLLHLLLIQAIASSLGKHGCDECLARRHAGFGVAIRFADDHETHGRFLWRSGNVEIVSGVRALAKLSFLLLEGDQLSLRGF